MSDMVERLAKIIGDHMTVGYELLPPNNKTRKEWNVNPKSGSAYWHESQDDCREASRAAIEALREPTEEMSTAGELKLQETDVAALIYQAMIDEILKP